MVESWNEESKVHLNANFETHFTSMPPHSAKSYLLHNTTQTAELTYTSCQAGNPIKPYIWYMLKICASFAFVVRRYKCRMQEHVYIAICVYICAFLNRECRRREKRGLNPLMREPLPMSHERCSIVYLHRGQCVCVLMCAPKECAVFRTL